MRGPCFGLLSDDTSFLEAEISLPVIHGLPNDHMIQELDLKHSGRFANPAGQPQISFARVGGLPKGDYVIRTEWLCGPRCLSGTASQCRYGVRIDQPLHIIPALFVAPLLVQLLAIASRLVQAMRSVDWKRHQLSVDLYKLIDRIRERYPLTFAYVTDNDCPAEAIQNVASKLGADMIIVSAHDKRMVSKATSL